MDGGSAQHFTVYYRRTCDDDSDCNDFIADPDREEDPGFNFTIQHKVTGLNESTDYECKVVAVNSYNGTGGNNTSTDEELGVTLGVY